MANYTVTASNNGSTASVVEISSLRSAKKEARGLRDQYSHKVSIWRGPGDETDEEILRWIRPAEGKGDRWFPVVP